MDILTPKGQETVQQEREMAEMWERLFDGWSYVTTQKDSPCLVDAVLVKDGVVHGLVETKCRIMTSDDLRQKFNNEWLLTFSKIDQCRLVCAALQVPLYGFLYCVTSKELLVVTLIDPSGEFVSPMKLKHTTTQRCVNGGTAYRYNAYIDMEDARTYTDESGTRPSGE